MTRPCLSIVSGLGLFLPRFDVFSGISDYKIWVVDVYLDTMGSYSCALVGVVLICCYLISWS